MAASAREIKSLCDKKVKILKWKVRKGSIVSKGSILALYSTVPDDGPGTTSKLKATETGTVLQLVAEEGEIIPPFGTTLLLQSQNASVCSHPTIMKDMCAECGADLREELGNAGDRKQNVSASVAMVHSIPELIVSQEQALELGKEDENRLLKERKLVLLVDLDQTLIHTTNDNIPPNLKDVKHFQLWHGKNYIWYHTRFRPYTEQFLQAVSKMYELHICTFGVRMYAHIIARLLDPKERYFSHRILSRDECFDSLSKTANLKALFPCGDTMVGIIDDREDVWNFAPNLVHVKPYRFFQGTADINAPPGLTKSENDNIPLKHKRVNQDNKDSEASAEGDSAEKKDADEADMITGKEETKAGADVTMDVDKQPESGQDPPSQEGSSLEKGEIKEKSGDGIADCKSSPDGSVTQCESVEQSTDAPRTTGDKLDTSASAAKDEKDISSCNKEEEGDEDQANKDHYQGDVLMGGREGSDGKDGDEAEVEWDDADDYLLHLEEILRRIHTAYYDMYEQSQQKKSGSTSDNGHHQLPDLKNIIPYVKKKILKGANVVFSGMFPLNVPMEKSKAYATAKALGANVQSDIVPSPLATKHNSDNGNSSKKRRAEAEQATTHLIAAKPGTGKYKTAVRTKGLRVVNGDWLWACAERWEWVDERLFSFPSTPSKGGGVTEEGGSGASVDSPRSEGRRAGGKRKKKATSADASLTLGDEDENEGADSRCSPSGEGDSVRPPKRSKNSDPAYDPSLPSSSSSLPTRAGNGGETFSRSYNPLYSFSDADIEFMDKEVDEILDDGESDESDDERDSRLRKEVLRESSNSDSDSDSLAGDFPRGWKLRRKSFSPHHSDHGSDKGRQTDEEVLDEDSENELERYQKTVEAFSPRDSCSDSDSEKDSIGSVDDEIAEAVEREFLGSL